MTQSKGTVCLMILLALSLGGCNSKPKPNAPAPQKLDEITMTLGGKPFQIEIADDEPEQQMGLMFRDSMPADHGMIFVFPEEEHRGFWMKNTRIPLDILYLDSQGTIVSIKSMKPYDLTEVPSDKPAQFAIELNEGMARSLKLKTGDKIAIPQKLTKASPTTTSA
jgi:uncharacterized membrane protein (UPF0127 family)